MPFRKIVKFGEQSDETEAEEGDEQEETEDLFKVRFPQAGYTRDLQNVDTLKSVLSKRIPEIRLNNICPILKRKVGIGKKPKLPTITTPKSKFDR